MTFKEKLAMEHPEAIDDGEFGGCFSCPHTYGYNDEANALCNTNGCCDNEKINDETCSECWNREMPEDMTSLAEASKNATEAFKNLAASIGEAEPRILDSGDRTEFETGAVRDMREGKGRCDLLPLDVVAEYIELRKSDRDSAPIYHISRFIEEKEIGCLYAALDFFAAHYFGGEVPDYTMLLEVAKHFEEGAKKYGDNNWRKGIPVRCYIDSAIRHYLKYLRGDKDEPHDRAFCWNILCAIWTCKHMPELNDYAKKEEGTNNA